MLSKRSPITLDVKLDVVKRCLQDDSNPHYEAKQLGVDKATVKDWIRKYEAEGFEGLEDVKPLLKSALKLHSIPLQISWIIRKP